MVRHHIPTAKYVEVTDFEKACKEVDHFDFPLVIKADGLAAGKGVVIVENKEDAISTLKEMMVDGALDGAGSKVVLEEFLTGFECSLLCFTDGKNGFGETVPIPPVLGPLFPSKICLWSFAETIGTIVLPSVKQSKEHSNPVKNSS